MALNGETNPQKSGKDEPNSRRYQNIKKNSELLKLAKIKAQSIVLSLLDIKVDKEYFAKNVVYLTRESFDDVAIERSLIGICGYSLCDQHLSDEKFKHQTYIIRNNKVYDITKRKNFCSNKCFQAFELLYHQIPTTPLYVRAEDKEIQNMQIIIPVKENLKGRYGKRVDVTGTSFDADLNLDDLEEHSNANTNDRLISSPFEEDRETYTSAQTSPTPSEEDGETYATPYASPRVQEEDCKATFSDSKHSNPIEKSSLYTKEEKEKEVKNTLNQNTISAHIITNEIEPSLVGGLFPAKAKTKLSNEIQKLSLNSVEKEPRSDSRSISIEQQNRSQSQSHMNDILEIEQVLREWMTFESLRIILGDVYVKGMLEHFGEIWEHYDRSSEMKFPRLDMKAKYIALCKKLNRQEIKERLEDIQEIEEDEGSFNKDSLKPMPDYERLKKDVEQSSLKVKAFYEGIEEYATNKESLGVIKEEDEDNTNKPSSSSKTKNPPKNKKADKADQLINLPLIDQYAQKTWRREIVFEKLYNGLAEFSHDFELDEGEIRKLVIPVIESFDFKSQNICFKTSQWKFVALIIFKMLSVRYPIIGKVFLPTEKSFHMITTYLRSAGLDECYLDRLLSYITDVSYILAKTEKLVSLESESEDSFGVKKCEDLSVKDQLKFIKESQSFTKYEELD